MIDSHNYVVSVEWHDQAENVTRTYLLTYHTGDKSVELVHSLNS